MGGATWVVAAAAAERRNFFFLHRSHVSLPFPPQEHLRWSVFVTAPVVEWMAAGSGMRITRSATRSASCSRGSLTAPMASFRCSGSGGRFGEDCSVLGAADAVGDGEAIGIRRRSGVAPSSGALRVAVPKSFPCDRIAALEDARERGDGDFRRDCADGISGSRLEFWEFGCISEYTLVFDIE
jgi:hypothetical protein